MKQMIFASDLDNTLLFSYKHKQDDDVCVEQLDGKAQGFCQKDSFQKLEDIQKKAWFVPITSRSMAQYQRICFPKSCMPKYALTTNGAILLVDGNIDAQWYADSKKWSDAYKTELQEMEKRLSDVAEIKRFRMIDEMYLFAACDNAEDAQKSKVYLEQNTQLQVLLSGRKLYFIPPMLDKGTALKRLREKFDMAYILSAGDSMMDIPMLEEADYGIFLHTYENKQEHIRCYDGQEVRDYTGFVLDCVLQQIAY